MQEPIVRASDRYVFSEEYFNTIKDALINNPTVDSIHFIINTHNCNLIMDVKPEDRYLMYEVRCEIDLKELKPQFTDYDLYTGGVILKLFEKYKRNLIIH